MAGHSRSRNGVASLAYVLAIHALTADKKGVDARIRGHDRESIQPACCGLRVLLGAGAAVEMPLGVKCRSSTRHSSYLSAGSDV
jgi:hypothetical protein